MLITNN